MKTNKTVFKLFSITQCREEERYLSDMHEEGWALRSITFPGFYHFEKCTPGDVSYCLDYNQDGLREKSEYVQMFKDCGWEYLFDFVGYSYFRKPCGEGEEREEIFCDDASRLEMMRRVFRGRLLPLILVFATCIVPQLFFNSFWFARVLSYIYLVLALVYLIIFAHSAYSFWKYEKEVSDNPKGVNTRYLGIALLLVFFTIMAGTVFWRGNRSIYQVSEGANGFTVEAQYLTSTVTREYDLKAGDTVSIRLDLEEGPVHVNIAADDKDPAFFGDFYQGGDMGEVIINKDGRYRIQVEGDRAKGHFFFEIDRAYER